VSSKNFTRKFTLYFSAIIADNIQVNLYFFTDKSEGIMKRFLMLGISVFAGMFFFGIIACNNGFFKDSRDAFAIPEQPGPRVPPFVWETKNVYLDPVGAEEFYPPTVSGQLNNYGYKFWLVKTTGIPPLVPNYLTLTPAPNSTPIITATVEESGPSHILLEYEKNDWDGSEITYNIAINPKAFRGADTDLFDTSAASVNITFSTPSKAEWAQHKIEGFDFDGFTQENEWEAIDWTVVDAILSDIIIDLPDPPTEDDVRTAMKIYALQKVAEVLNGEDNFTGYPVNLTHQNIFWEHQTAVPTPLSAHVDPFTEDNIVWNTEPDLTLGYIDGDDIKYRLTAHITAEDSTVDANFSVVIEFTSNVGKTVKSINDYIADPALDPHFPIEIGSGSTDEDIAASTLTNVITALLDGATYMFDGDPVLDNTIADVDDAPDATYWDGPGPGTATTNGKIFFLYVTIISKDTTVENVPAPPAQVRIPVTVTLP
jgi:hypothetical protein